MRKQTNTTCVLFCLMLLTFPAQAQTPQATLKQYMSDLQKSPNDNALREKIIRQVQTMRPAPVIPEETTKYVNRGMAAAEGAKNERDYKDAIEEFQKAVNVAPWLGGGYRNLAVMQDKAGQYSQALQNLRLYLLTNPPSADAEAAKALIYKIEYRQEKAAKESSPAAIATKKQNEYEEWLKKIDGAQWEMGEKNATHCADFFMEVHGREIRAGWIVTRPYAECLDSNPHLGDSNSVYSSTLDGRNYLFQDKNSTKNGTISEDGEVIIETWSFSDTAQSYFNSGKSSYMRVRNQIGTLWK